MNTIKQLTALDIVISIYNQEKIIKKVLKGVFQNTTTPFNLILVFDGCTDKTEAIAKKYIQNHKPRILKNLIIEHAANVYETRANNIGFKKAKENFMITIQDDMVINELGWERRLTFPLRKYQDIFAVTSRTAQNIISNNERVEYTERKSAELGNLPRNIFAIRDVINRGPVAFNVNHLRDLNYLDENYAPSDLDDADLCLRAWKTKRLRCGVFWIDYISRLEWGKARAKDSTMEVNKAISKNEKQLISTHKEYIISNQKHDDNLIITNEEIDYIKVNPRQLKRLETYGSTNFRLLKGSPIKRFRKNIENKFSSIFPEIGNSIKSKGIKKTLIEYISPK